MYYTFLYYEAFKRAIVENNVEVILITSSIGLFEKTAMVAAKDLKRKVVLAQHGVGANFRKTDMTFFNNLHFAVFGEIDKHKLINSGISVDNIHVIGSLIFDDIIEYKSETHNNQIDNILFVTQDFVEANFWTEKQRDQFFKEILNIAKEFNCKITIKLHPRENIEIYKKYFKNQKNIEILKEDLYNSIKNSDLVIGVFSTALSEAIILDKPTVALDLFKDTRNYTDLINKEIMLYLEDTTEIKKKIMDYFKNYYDNQELRNKRQEYIKNYFYKIDGNASERAIELIKDLCQN